MKKIFITILHALLFCTTYSQMQIEHYYSNRQLSEVGAYDKSGHQIGEWKFYYENGQLKDIGKFNNAQKVGGWKSYYENGQLAEIGNYNHDLKVGEWKYYYETGFTKEMGSYNQNGNMHGEWHFYYETGQLKEITNYYEDGLPGLNKSYYQNGQLSQIGTYDRRRPTSLGLLQGVGLWKTYYENGQLEKVYTLKPVLIFTGEWLSDFVGEYKTYFSNGRIKAIGNYSQNGEMQGLWKFYYETGQLEKIGTVKGGGGLDMDYPTSGIQDNDDGEGNLGLWKFYYENGQLKEIGNYDFGGAKHGEWKSYYENGQLKEIGNYDDENKKLEEWKSYYENGFLKAIGKFEFDKRRGEWKYYYINGQLKAIGIFDFSMYPTRRGYAYPQGKWKFYYENGQLKEVGNYLDTDLNQPNELTDIGRSGLWVFYNNNGQLEEIGTFVNNKRDGEWKYYYKSGQLKEIINYRNGIIDGEIKSYPEDLSYTSIYNQTWTTKNLSVSRYRNGDVIPEVTDSTAWANLTTGAWCWYNNDSSTYASTYGKLYNWYAVNDSRGLAPAGWHIPSNAEWTKLTDTFLGGGRIAGGKMKTTGTIQAGTGLWNSPNTATTNSSGFAGLPGGYRKELGKFNFIGNKGYWWSSTGYEYYSYSEFEYNTTYAYGCDLYYYDSSVVRQVSKKTYGLSVRCLRD